jgi:hypothetical protein
MIGDSWTALHSSWKPDSIVSYEWSLRTGRPVLFMSCGRGGANAGDVYRLMFREAPGSDSCCSQPLLERLPDYCIVTVGINDARQNVGKDSYCTNYQLIVRHLLSCGTRPVILEIPDVDLKSAYGKKPFKDKLADVYRAILTWTCIYSVMDYRSAWRRKLEVSGLMDSVIYISRDSWNAHGYRDTSFYLEDCIHLNDRGYAKLDSCLFEQILKGYNGSK